MSPRKKTKLLCRLGALLMASSAILNAQAQVPAAIEAGLQKIGPIVDPPCTAKLYRPLMPGNDAGSSASPLYPGISISRDVTFGPNRRDIVDIFYADKGAASRPVLIFVAGGAGNKVAQQLRESNAFYDNVMRWATKNGMVGVNMERHPGSDWDDGAKDMSRMIQFLQANISQYRGDPRRMIIWAHSAGNVPTGIYLGHPELWGPQGVGVKGVIFMSGQFNALPAAGPNAAAASTLVDSGKACGLPPGAVFATAGAIEGPGRAMPSNGPQPAPPKVDPAVELSRSSLPGLRQANVRIMLATAELDPGANGKISAFNQALHEELCKEGAAHCPTLLYEKSESHMSEVYAIDTPDKTVSGPVLAWIHKTLR